MLVEPQLYSYATSIGNNNARNVPSAARHDRPSLAGVCAAAHALLDRAATEIDISTLQRILVLNVTVKSTEGTLIRLDFDSYLSSRRKKKKTTKFLLFNF